MPKIRYNLLVIIIILASFMSLDKSIANPSTPKLDKVPQILEILGLGDKTANIKLASETTHKNKFYGEIAVALGYTTQAPLEAGLRKQSELIADAAVHDIEIIAQSGKYIQYPGWVKPHWGNEGKVNDVTANVTKDVAASAAANVAKLITLLANKSLNLAKEAQPGVEAARNLTRAILSDNPPKAEELLKWCDQADKSLRLVAKDTDPVDEYIQKRFAEIDKGIELAITPALNTAFDNEIHSIKSYNNPKVNTDTTAVLVLSARHSYLKKNVESSPQNANAEDIDDGFNRMLLGIIVAKSVAAKKLNKSADVLTNAELISHGPVIIYNGEPESNKDLHTALAAGSIEYPTDKFRIFELQDKTQYHTRGQLYNLYQNWKNNQVKLEGTLVIVSSAYHVPRIVRTLASCQLSIADFPAVKFQVHSFDRDFQSPGVDQEIASERSKLPGYVVKRFISPYYDQPQTYNGAARSYE